MPAYNAELTLRHAYSDTDRPVVDEVILVDDCSRDNTVQVANDLGISCIIHPHNLGSEATRRPVTRRRSRVAPTSL